jgi:hypothetical protein
VAVILSARSLFREIIDDDAAFRLFASVAAAGEAQGGWENGRIAALLPESLRDLAPKVVRHGADEDKHARIFRGLLRRRGLTPVPVPLETDYTALLEAQGIGLAHTRLRREVPLTEQDVVVYLAHSRVTEQRAAGQMAMLCRHFGDDPLLGRAVRQIADDEANHLAYCHEELLRLSEAGHERFIRDTLRRTALAESETHRDVSLAVMEHMTRLLGWSPTRAALVRAGIQAVAAAERAGRWRRATCLTPPERRDPLGTPAASEEEAGSAETAQPAESPEPA